MLINLGDRHSKWTSSSFSIIRPFAKTTTIRIIKIFSVCYIEMIHLKIKAKVLERRKNVLKVVYGWEVEFIVG